MKQVWKRNIVAATVLLFVCAAVYLNWKYASNVSDTGGDEGKILGQSTLVSGQEDLPGTEAVETGGEISSDTAGTTGDYFAAARLTRQQARDSAISLLREASESETADAAVAEPGQKTRRFERSGVGVVIDEPATRQRGRFVDEHDRQPRVRKFRESFGKMGRYKQNHAGTLLVADEIEQFSRFQCRMDHRSGRECSLLNVAIDSGEHACQIRRDLSPARYHRNSRQSAGRICRAEMVFFKQPGNSRTHGFTDTGTVVDCPRYRRRRNSEFCGDACDADCFGFS